MNALRIKLLAFQGATQAMRDDGLKTLQTLLATTRIDQVEDAPDILFFLSGGSEQHAASVIQPAQFYILLAGSTDNAYAAATEVKAFANQHAIRTVLLNTDDPDTPKRLKHYIAILRGLNRLHGQHIGIFGHASPWLIASSTAAADLNHVLGIKIKRLLWDQLPDYHDEPINQDFLNVFRDCGADLTSTSRLYTLLSHCIEQEHLNAITVECFPLVKQHGITACLPLALLNNNGIPAGCEGDITSITGMMLAKEAAGRIPWIANLAHISHECVRFAHCTVAPALLNRYAITTHFETGKGTAIQGHWTSSDVTVFRLNKTLNRAFIAHGPVLRRPQLDTACRTQIEVGLTAAARCTLQEDPLGNHHLILPGNLTKLLKHRLSGTGHLLPNLLNRNLHNSLQNLIQKTTGSFMLRIAEHFFGFTFFHN